MKKSKLRKIDSIDKLAEFWDTHDLTDFEDELEEVAEPIFVLGSAIKVPLKSREAEAVQRMAQAKGVSAEELIRTWVLQQLASRSNMNAPCQVDIPFFAYGIFQPGQLGFHRLCELVLEKKPSSMPGTLRIRDGLPIIDPEGSGKVSGTVIVFKPGKATEAYKRIGEIEPDKQYRWEERNADGILVNVLVGKSPKKGSVESESSKWDGKSDPLFTSALEVVEETLNSNLAYEPDLKPLFRLQMAYLLLWSSIERYVSLRYHLGDKAIEKVNSLLEEPAFARALQANVQNRRTLFRADRPGDKVTLDPNNPRKSLEYYYQIRSNIVHRGKAVIRDHHILKDSLSELLSIFQSVLRDAFASSDQAHASADQA